MPDENNLLDRNLSALIKAGQGPETLPNIKLRRKMLKRLLALQARSQVQDFPLPVLTGLTGLLGIVTASAVFRGVFGDAATPAIWIGLSIGAINLAWIPLAGLIIIISRRKQHAKQN